MNEAFRIKQDPGAAPLKTSAAGAMIKPEHSLGEFQSAARVLYSSGKKLPDLFYSGTNFNISNQIGFLLGLSSKFRGMLGVPNQPFFPHNLVLNS